MELLTLIKLDLKTKYTIIFNTEKKLKKLFLFFLIFILLVTPIELLIFKYFNIFNIIGKEKYLLFIILLAEFIILSFTLFIGTMNNLFLENNISFLYFYPIKDVNLFYYKFSIEYIKGLIVTLISLIPLITFGILDNFIFLDYIKLVVFSFLLPFALLVIILNTLLFLLIPFSNKKYIPTKIIFYIIQFIAFILIHTYLGSKSNAIILFIAFSLLLICFIFFNHKIYLNIILNPPKFKNIMSNKTNAIKFDFNSALISLIKRDLLEIFRTPILVGNLIILNIIFSSLIILLIPILKNIILRSNTFIVFITIVLSTVIVSLNTIVNLSYSRESKNLKYLYVLPISLKKLFLSKFIVALILNTVTIIFLNILFISLNLNFKQLLVLNLTTLFNFISLTLINIKSDLTSSKKLSLNLSEAFNDVELILTPLIKSIPLTLLFTIIFIVISRLNISYSYDRTLIICTFYLLTNFLLIIKTYNDIKSINKYNLI